MKDSTNGKKPIRTPWIQKLDLGVRKPGGSDIDWSNFCRDQATHFVGCTESPNVPNSFYNRKKNVIHPRRDQLCAYHLLTKKKHK
jgi:hypothetical protein